MRDVLLILTNCFLTFSLPSPQWHLKLPIDDDIDDDGDNDGVVEGDDDDGDDDDDYGDDDGDDAGDDDGDRVIVKVIEIAQPCSS